MSSAASATTPARDQPTRSPRRDKSFVTRRAALQLLAGLLVVAGIPVVATVRILDANALHNERARADAALVAQFSRPAEPAGPVRQRRRPRRGHLALAGLAAAFLTKDRTVIAELARKNPGLVFYLKSERVAGNVPRTRR